MRWSAESAGWIAGFDFANAGSPNRPHGPSKGECKWHFLHFFAFWAFGRIGIFLHIFFCIFRLSDSGTEGAGSYFLPIHLHIFMPWGSSEVRKRNFLNRQFFFQKIGISME